MSFPPREVGRRGRDPSLKAVRCGRADRPALAERDKRIVTASYIKNHIILVNMCSSYNSVISASKIKYSPIFHCPHEHMNQITNYK